MLYKCEGAMKMVGQRTTRFMVLVVTHGNGKLQSIDDVEKNYRAFPIATFDHRFG